MTSLITLFLVIAAMTATNGWLINVRKTTVSPNDNVHLRCDSTGGDNGDIFTVQRISMSKLSKNNRWEWVAVLGGSQTTVMTSLTDAKVDGDVGDISDTFIEIKFKTATDQSIGQFVCEVEGTDLYGDIKGIKTAPVIIKRKKLSRYEQLLKTIMELKKGNDEVDEVKEDVKMIKKDIDDIHKTLHNNTRLLEELTEPRENLDLWKALKHVADLILNEVNTTISTRMDEIRADLDSVVRNVTDRQAQIESKINAMSSAIDNITDCCDKNKDKKGKNKDKKDGKEDDALWPEGHYLLPEADSGCHNTTTTSWQESSIRISTGPANNNKDARSRDLDLAGDVFQKIGGNSYVTLKACRVLSKSQNVKWPLGMYCIQGYKYNHDNYDNRFCPYGFHFGEIRYGRFDDGRQDMARNMDVVTKDDGTYIPYCCRQDGSFNDAITLPTASPFFLYRYGGKCQQVVGMDVKEQWIHLGTGRWTEGNYYYSEDDNIYHPDGMADDSSYESTNRGARIEFCYYTPRE